MKNTNMKAEQNAVLIDSLLKYKEKKIARRRTREWLDKHNARKAKRRLKKKLK